jgi:hypothetical protein
MVFSLRSPKLSDGLAETSKNSAETLKVSEISKTFVEIPKIFEKKKMLTLFGDSGDFCRVSKPVLNLTASFWVQSLRSFFGDSGT